MQALVVSGPQDTGKSDLVLVLGIDDVTSLNVILSHFLKQFDNKTPIAFVSSNLIFGSQTSTSNKSANVQHLTSQKIPDNHLYIKQSVNDTLQ